LGYPHYLLERIIIDIHFYSFQKSENYRNRKNNILEDNKQINVKNIKITQGGMQEKNL